ncbi:MAG: TonB-dependent receptor domain-containing protein [Parvularculaceae bacterium]
MRKSTLAAQLMRTTILTGAAVAFAMPAFAQDEDAEDDEVVVTGSRIQRDNFEAPSPVASVSAEQLTLTNTVNSEEFLDSLPQVVPSFDSSSNNPGTGTATVSLRGLGTNRTLVLVNGLRFVGSGAGGPVDLNNIPASLVDRIDVVTGGASAVYGSDAVAGVVNFILKDDFEGVQLDVTNRLSASGWDANTFQASVTLGGNFADGRGNAVISASYTNREALFQGDRDFSEFTFIDPGAGSTSVGFIPGGSSSVPGTRIRGRTTNHFGLSGAGLTGPYPECIGNTCSGFFFPDGTSNLQGLRFGNPNDLYNYAPSNYLQLPQERYSLFGSATYEINDSIEVYARGLYATNVVDSQLAPTPYGFTVAVNNNNPLIPAELLGLFLADPASNGVTVGSVPNSGPGFTTFRFNRRGIELGNRNSLRESNTFQFAGGIKVDVGNDWVWKTEAQFGRSGISSIQSGNVSIAAVRQAVLTTDGVNCTNPSGGCVPLNLFGGPNGVSPGAAAFISRTGAIIEEVEQTQIVSTLGGEFSAIKSPFAESGVALVVGVEYREESARSIPDSVLGPDVLGFNQAPPAAGSFDVYEAFMETQIPVFEDSAIGDLGINGAFRYSDYSTAQVGSTISYAGGAEWAPLDGLRLRGQYQRAVRAPNIGELFTAVSNGFPGARDPCSSGTFGSFGLANPLGAPIAATCVSTGVPLANVGTSFQSNGQIEALFGGQPNLSEESASTLTFGAVIQPSFIEGLTVQVDWYNIEIDEAIVTVGLQAVLDSCHRLNVASQCAIIVRDPSTGEIASPFLPTLFPQNIAAIQEKGIDAQVNYDFDIGSLGSIAAVYYGNYRLKSNILPDPATGLIECTGLFAGRCGEPTQTYKHTAQVSWLYGPLTSSVRWRLIGGVDAEPGTGVSDLSDNIDLFNYVDVTMRYAVNENLDLTLGVQNILSKDAPILGSTNAEQANTYPATYDTLGRQLFFGASLKF